MALFSRLRFAGPSVTLQKAAFSSFQQLVGKNSRTAGLTWYEVSHIRATPSCGEPASLFPAPCPAPKPNTHPSTGVCLQRRGPSFSLLYITPFLRSSQLDACGDRGTIAITDEHQYSLRVDQPVAEGGHGEGAGPLTHMLGAAVAASHVSLQKGAAPLSTMVMDIGAERSSDRALAASAH